MSSRSRYTDRLDDEAFGAPSAWDDTGPAERHRLDLLAGAVCDCNHSWAKHDEIGCHAGVCWCTRCPPYLRSEERLGSRWVQRLEDGVEE